MTVGQLSIKPITLRNVQPNQGSKLFVGVYVLEQEKTRTHSVESKVPEWNTCLTCKVPEGQNTLTVELIDESSYGGGLLGTGKFNLDTAFRQGGEDNWVMLTKEGRPVGEIRLNVSFEGNNPLKSMTHQMGGMHIANPPSFPSESRQSSFASLGPANPIPQNYGAGTPPPFTPPAPIRYNSDSSMPSPGATVQAETLTREEFEEAKAKGTIPNWAKYGGGVLAGAAALGMAAWGAHELKEHYENKQEEEERKKPLKVIDQQHLPYKIENPAYQQPAVCPPKQDLPQPAVCPPKQAYPQPAVCPPKQAYPQPAVCPPKHEPKHKKEKKDKKKHHGRRGSSSSSDSDDDKKKHHGRRSSSSSSDSDDDKKKSHKHKDNQWK